MLESDPTPLTLVPLPLLWLLSEPVGDRNGWLNWGSERGEKKETLLSLGEMTVGSYEDTDGATLGDGVEKPGP